MSAARELKFVSVDELVKQTGSSLTTLRRDINALTRMGKIEKVRGGISYSVGDSPTGSSYNYINSEKGFQAEKVAAGKGPSSSYGTAHRNRERAAGQTRR